jgi:DNA-binding HxlR family transcriptional regulator
MSAHTSPRLLDDFDIYLIVAIGQGVNSCAYLADSTGKGRSTISTRIQVLEKYKLVTTQPTKQKHFSIEYALTAMAQQLVADTFYDFNRNYLEKLKKLRINTEVVE